MTRDIALLLDEWMPLILGVLLLFGVFVRRWRDRARAPGARERSPGE
jgi:hypothetical protein